MADFILGSERILRPFEGLYSMDKDDPGGETYHGIARNMHPSWRGWPLIDLNKRLRNFPKILESISDLKRLENEFYKKEFWDRFQGDELEQVIAEELFDQTVNFGVSIGVKNFQRAINMMNDRGNKYDNIPVDGDFGEKTLNAYKLCIYHRSVQLLFNIMNCMQAYRYIFLMESNESKEKYIGWFNRIEVKRI